MKVVTPVQIFHLLHWIHKQLQTQTQHGSFSPRSVPESPRDGSASWVLEPPGRNPPPPHNCCTVQHEAETLDWPDCCLDTHTDTFYTKTCGMAERKKICLTYNMMVSSKQMSVKVLSTITRSVSWISVPHWSRQNTAQRWSSAIERNRVKVTIDSRRLAICIFIPCHYIQSGRSGPETVGL